MFFKSLFLMRVDAQFLEQQIREDALYGRPFAPCEANEASRSGWVGPVGFDGEPLARSVNGFTVICMQREEKIIPAASVRDLVSDKVAELEKKRGTPVGRKERMGIKEEVYASILPRALTRRERVHAYIDPEGWLIINTSSATKADALVELLGRSLKGGVGLRSMLGNGDRIERVLTSWIIGGPPDGFALGDVCELVSYAEDGGVIKCRHDLTAEEIIAHASLGKSVSRLGLVYRDRLEFVVGGDMVIRSLKFMDIVHEDVGEADEVAGIFDAEFSVMALEVRALLAELVELFSIGGK